MQISAGAWKWIGVGGLLVLSACSESSPPVTPASVPADLSVVPGPSSTDMSTTPPQTMNAAVSVMDNFYSPADVTISVGGTVTWTWAGAVAHTVTSNTGVFDSSPPRTTGTFAFTFANAGTFPYHCLVHGFAMSGTVTVR